MWPLGVFRSLHLKVFVFSFCVYMLTFLKRLNMNVSRDFSQHLKGLTDVRFPLVIEASTITCPSFNTVPSDWVWNPHPCNKKRSLFQPSLLWFALEKYLVTIERLRNLFWIKALKASLRTVTEGVEMVTWCSNNEGSPLCLQRSERVTSSHIFSPDILRDVALQLHH